MQRAYYKKGATYKFVKSLLALPFLPADQIPTAFCAFRVKNSPLQPLVQYVSSTWMDNQQWPPAAWSVFGRAIRTNNDLEGWHTRFNTNAKRNSFNLYLLIDLVEDQGIFEISNLNL